MPHLRRTGFAILLGALAFSAPALAWGPEAHGMIAAMAEAHLTPPAAAEVRRLLAADIDDKGKPVKHTRLDEASSWPDAWRPTHQETGPWHFVDIPLDKPAFDDARDCHLDSKNQHTAERTCIVAKIPEFAKALADKGLGDARRVEALKFLIHFVGDITQPLHAEDKYSADGKDDHGGNFVRMPYYNVQTNLHLVWDQSVPEKHYGWAVVQPPDYAFDHAAARQAAQIMDARIDPKDRASWGTPDLFKDLATQTIVWANESHALAPAAYANVAMSEDAYQAYAWPVAERQMQKASVRLAELLNEILR